MLLDPEKARQALNERITAGRIVRTVAPDRYSLVWWSPADENGRRFALAEIRPRPQFIGTPNPGCFYLQGKTGRQYRIGPDGPAYARALRLFEALTR